MMRQLEELHQRMEKETQHKIEQNQFRNSAQFAGGRGEVEVRAFCLRLGQFTTLKNFHFLLHFF